MLSRVALDREREFADVVLDFLLDVDTSWPDLIEVRRRPPRSECGFESDKSRFPLRLVPPAPRFRV